MKREFSIGSEWLYYKIYCGVKTADFMLHDSLKEGIENLLAEKYISKWFFIRYNDPDSHIRLRFKIDNLEHIGIVIIKLQVLLGVLQEQNLIWKIQTDTYVRELERYGSTTYELSETIFQADSELVLAYIDLKNYFENDTTALLFSFQAIDQFLTLFELTKEEKLKLLDRLQTSFKNEFQADKTLKKELDKQYRSFENELESFLTFQQVDNFAPIYEVVELKSKKIASFMPKLKENLDVDLFSFSRVTFT